MGNQCSPRTYQNIVSQTQHSKNNAPNKVTLPSHQMNPSSQNSGSQRESRQSVDKQVIFQNSISQNISKQLKQKAANGVDSDASENNANTPTKDMFLKSLQTSSTLMDENKEGLKASIPQRALTSTELSKRNIQVNIEDPSEIRDSLCSAWNKSNFDEGEFFKSVHYTDIFVPNSSLRGTNK